MFLKKKTDPKFRLLNEFVDATSSSLREVCRCNSQPVSHVSATEEVDVLVISELTIDKSEFESKLRIGFPAATFMNLLETLLGQRFQSIDEELLDAASEILNITYGRIKKTLSEDGYKLPMSIPKSRQVDPNTTEIPGMRTDLQTELGILHLWVE